MKQEHKQKTVSTRSEETHSEPKQRTDETQELLDRTEDILDDIEDVLEEPPVTVEDYEDLQMALVHKWAMEQYFSNCGCPDDSSFGGDW